MFWSSHRCWKSAAGAAATGAAACLLVVLIVGCGVGTPAARPQGAGPTGGPESGEVAAVFAHVAAVVQPMPVYGWQELPSSWRVSDEWWPVVEYSSRSEYLGDISDNPQIAAAGTDYPQAQVVFSNGDSWMVFVEDFRGDLGDSVGTPVGEVAAHAATLYDVNAGRLVQWSDSGRWYGVFSRGVSRDELVALALSAEVIEPDEATGQD